MSSSNGSRRLQFWLGMLISALSIGILFFFVDLEQVATELRSASYPYLGLSLIGISLFLLLRAVRWRFLLQGAAPLHQIFHVQNIGYLITYILPFRLGDVARGILIGNLPGVGLSAGLSTMVVERVLDLLFIVVLLPFTLAGVPRVPAEYQLAARSMGVLAALATIALLIVANQRGRIYRLVIILTTPIRFLDTERWARRADNLLAGMSTLTRLRDIAILIVLSVLVWLPIIFAYYTALQAVHLNPTVSMAGFTVGAAALVVAAPSSPGQVGVFHLGVTAALEQVLRQPRDPAFSFAVLYHAANTVVVLVFGLIGVNRVQVDLGNLVAAARQLRRS
ncbi:MAG: lysylphosphatidylglycerol synthase transmembrane domain-containing protein [Anaerolineae bacterium]|nr:lysylphosphatidylglycerol synthase transmembrane domain-containing protein [Anaerolineae bacterium]